MTQTTSRPAAAPRETTSDKPLIHVNGKLLPKSQAVVSVFDHGLLYGDGVFEGIRIYNGKIFKLQQHLDRLWASAEMIHLKIPISKDEMTRIQRECVEANGIVNGYIRLIVTRGVGDLGLNPNNCPRPGIICIADQIRLYPEAMYKSGMRVAVAERPRIPVASLDPRIKSLNYLNNILGKCEAIHLSDKLGITAPEDKLLEVIMLNPEGKVAEGSGDNIFALIDNKLVTPPVTSGLLEGITRRFVIDTLCPACGVQVEERELTLDQLLAAKEIFMTGSAAEMIAVREVVKHKNLEVTETIKISDGEGPVTAKLRNKFREIVTSDHVPED